MKSMGTTETDAGRTAAIPESHGIFDAMRAYWNVHIHDLEIARHPVGTQEFFQELEEYRFQKLDYLPRVVDFSAYRGKRLLEVGCGIGIDLVRFAGHGAIAMGIDLSETAIELAKENFAHKGVGGKLLTMNGESLEFDDDSFDVVYAHGVLQYTHDTGRMIREIHRVLRPGGQAILMVYNRHSWLYFLSKLFGTKLEHEEAPAFKTYSIRGFKRMLRDFSRVEVIPERFPVKTHLHHGLKASVYNALFVGTFNLIPRPVVRPFGWHIMAKAIK